MACRVPDYRLSRNARAALKAIFESSLDQWGLHVADRYVHDLHRTFGGLVDFPMMGRSSEELGAGLFRISSGSHVVFYRQVRGDILIVRVLHDSQDFRRHL